MAQESYNPNWGEHWEEVEKKAMGCEEIRKRQKEIAALPTREERDKLRKEIMDKYL